ncbi:MAG: GDP-mannose 4,6-dehydratase [Alphaproteobacteria bacterium]
MTLTNLPQHIKGQVLVTGAAGFIGFHVTKQLLEAGVSVVGIDCFSDYYDVSLKENRTALLQAKFPHTYKLFRVRLEDKEAMQKVWAQSKISHVVHLAAQAGVRYSMVNPYEYVTSNVMGQVVLLECIRHAAEPVVNFVYASTSSVYGANPNLPFKESDATDTPMSLYAATKKSDELMTQSYSHLFRIPAIALRFFTVYGPWGRPDMALFMFTKNILAGKSIPVFNHGKMKRDFTYVEDIVQGILKALIHPPVDKGQYAPHRVYNLGNSKAESLMTYIEEIEKQLGKKAEMNFLPMQKADVPETLADVTRAREELGYSPKTSIAEGIANFIEWYRGYYG